MTLREKNYLFKQNKLLDLQEIVFNTKTKQTLATSLEKAGVWGIAPLEIAIWLGRLSLPEVVVTELDDVVLEQNDQLIPQVGVFGELEVVELDQRMFFIGCQWGPKPWK